ncbi:Synapse differentiation-inducing gene protein 1, partial [Eschrichtius robustus]|nr:Synapse differentiation-inducing gene protein 1 [Eschrichtius robustus]
MAGVVEQKSGLVRSKLGEAGKRNGLINTRSLVAESRDGLVSVYPAPQYQSCRVVGNAAPAAPDGSRNKPVQQLLDPNTLQQSVESLYRPNIILYSEGVLHPWGDSVAADCCETTFIEDRSPAKESLEYPDGKFLDLSPEDIKIHTLSYDVEEEEEEFQELEEQGLVTGAFPLPPISARTGLPSTRSGDGPVQTGPLTGRTSVGAPAASFASGAVVLA